MWLNSGNQHKQGRFGNTNPTISIFYCSFSREFWTMMYILVVVVAKTSLNIGNFSFTAKRTVCHALSQCQHYYCSLKSHPYNSIYVLVYFYFNKCMCVYKWYACCSFFFSQDAVPYHVDAKGVHFVQATMIVSLYFFIVAIYNCA